MTIVTVTSGQTGSTPGAAPGETMRGDEAEALLNFVVVMDMSLGERLFPASDLGPPCSSIDNSRQSTSFSTVCIIDYFLLPINVTRTPEATRGPAGEETILSKPGHGPTKTSRRVSSQESPTRAPASNY